MDILPTTAPRSDQMNYDDVMTESKTVTVTEVKKGSAEQPVEIHLAEFPGRPYKPGKSMRRVLVACWGSEASTYVGRTLTLYGDPTIRFGKEAVGGIRISHLSHIDEPKTINLTVTRGKRSPFIVQPLNPPKDVSGRDWLTELTKAANDLSAVQALGIAARDAHADPTLLKIIRAKYTELNPTTA